MDHVPQTHRAFTRRAVLAGLLTAAGGGLLAACAGNQPAATNVAKAGTAVTGAAGTAGTSPATAMAGGAATAGTGAATAATGSGTAVATGAAGAGTAVATGATGAGTAAATSATGAATAAATPVGTAVATKPAGAAGTPAAGATGTPAAAGTPAATYTKERPPTWAQASNNLDVAALRGQKLTYYGDTVGIGAELDKLLADQFQKDTGVTVNVVPKPQSATEAYAAYLRLFQAQSADIDTMMIDVIWPGAMAQHLLPLGETLGQVASQHYPGIIQNNTINNQLVAMPYFADFGMLFYRTDLLQKHGFAKPPATWDELDQQARKIIDAEKGANANMVGFVFQGNAYEGLTCNALEWLSSSGAGTIIDQNKRVTLMNEQAVAILNKAKGWVGGISPRGVTSYQEEDARNVFQGGNAVFMRNWPYAYSLAAGQAGGETAVKGKFGVAALPAAAGQKNAGTVGGWQLGVSKYSKNQQPAIAFVRYMTSPAVQTYRAVVGSFVPTIGSVAADPAVVQAQPFLADLQSVERVTRPAAATGERYNEVSTAFFQGVNQILNGGDAAQVLPQIEQRIQRVVGG